MTERTRFLTLVLTLLLAACSRNSDNITGPKPSLTGVEPQVVCLDQGGKGVVLSGDGLAPLILDAATDDAKVVLPELFLTRTHDLEGNPVSGAAEIQVPEEDVSWQSQQSITARLAPELGLDHGVYSIRVLNGSGQEAQLSPALVVAAPPDVEAVAPARFCGAQQAVEMNVQGSGFLQVGEDLPGVTAGGEPFPADELGDCVTLEGFQPAIKVCEVLIFTLPAGALEPGWQDLIVVNPEPADCETVSERAFYLFGPPQIVAVGPAVACDQSPTDLVISGSDFLVLDSEDPAVTIEGVDAQVTMQDCTPITDLPTASLCTTIQASVPAGTVELGDYQVTVVNPGEISCQDSFTGHIGLPPQVSGISPLEMCSVGGTLTVTGDLFVDGSVVSLYSGVRTYTLQTTFIDAQTLTALVPDPIEVGLYDVTVTNPDGCEDTLEDALDITPMPVVFFVDPTYLYNGVNIQVTVYVTGILGEVAEVNIYPTGQPGSPTSLTFSYDMQSRIQAVVPAGLDAGLYDIQVTDELGCTGTLAAALEIVAVLSVAIDRVELPFGWTSARTGVNVYSPDDPGPDMVNFQATPRFYLNPADAGADTVASELRHTAFVSPTRASASVPDSLQVGMYDLIAQNPDGGIGLLEDAFRVTELPPPVIYGLAPASVINQDVQSTTILGANFRNPAFSADCLQPDTSTAPLVGTIGTNDASSIQVSFDFTDQTIQDGSICLVKVTNDDDTYAVYSALGVTNPSLNLEFFSATTPMITARRAPCAVAGDATPGARFVYAIGGDDGTSNDSVASTYYDSIEMTPIDPYGELGDWLILPYALPAPRSFHACTSIGRYIFVAGGNGGAGAEATVWRSMILDPEYAPQITDVDIYVEPDPSKALLPGRYSYRVSALRPSDDPENPGGETLAGEPFQVQIPDITQEITITIGWTEVVGSVGYRIYRTPEPNLPSGTEVLIGEVDGETLLFADDGTAQPGSETPLPLGALGRFRVLPAMGTTREGAAVAWARDPQDPDWNYLYVMGGRDAAGNGLASIERLDIQIQADGTQSIGAAWIGGSADIGPPRWQLQIFLADRLTAPDILPQTGDWITWIYAAGGAQADLADMVPNVVALQVEVGGALGESAGTRYEVDTMQPYRTGYAVATFNNQLFAFGGSQGAQGVASLESSSIEMCGIVTSACSGTPDPPDLSNWNNLGIDLTVPRFLHAGVTASAFIFLVGGIDNSDPPVVLDATEKTLW